MHDSVVRASKSLLVAVAVASGACGGDVTSAPASPDAASTSDAADAAKEAETTTAGGTWTDPATGLTWETRPSPADVTWEQAIDRCDSLYLGGHTDWRLPTISELRSLIRGCPATETGGACGETDSCTAVSCTNDPCTGCLSGRGPGRDGCFWPEALEGTCGWYWSDSRASDAPGYACFAEFTIGHLSHQEVWVPETHHGMCVRP